MSDLNDIDEMDNEPAVEAMPDMAREIFGYGLPAVEHYAQMLVEEGELRGLLGPRELSRLWSRHIINCAALLDYLPNEGTLADLGSGAGLPGIVIACARPELEVTLVESMERRYIWLDICRDELGLDNVEILPARAEELHKKMRFDVVTARAVGNVSKMLRWGAPLVKSPGDLVLLKGQKVDEEIAGAKAGYLFKKFKMELPVVHEVPSPTDSEVTRVMVSHKK